MMIKQTLTFRSPVSLSLKNKQLVIQLKDTDQVVTRPIEDIGVVIVENQMVRMTVPLLNELAENNVAVILCDGHAMPRSMLMTLEGNETLQEAYRFQLDAAQPVKKQAWKQIVESKIMNQSNLLTKLGKEGRVLKPYYMNVKSADSDNREGAAARAYWSLLFDASFRRSREGEAPNSLLNYGYTILRAAVARALLGSGLYPAFGIFHRNRYNAFPLADDVMEPYRPFVDEIVYHLYMDGSHSELTSEVKVELQKVLFCDVMMGSVTRPLEVAISLTTASFLRMLKGEVSKLSLPVL
jgi:CRISPR-associated protein Cas1